MTHLSQAIHFIHNTQWHDLPDSVQHMARRCLLDLIGVAASGTQTQLSKIIRDHAVMHFGSSTLTARLLFDGRTCSPSGAALANGMTIDSIDAHDGYKPVKGHAGCGVVAGLLAMHDAISNNMVSETEFLTGLVIGYEIACRAGYALHHSVSDYHTSGAWVSLATAAIAARTLKLDSEQTRHALGIAEYHGPRSQMMRCIDHPTMLKDGSGWGAMAGISAAFLAKDGFTGAPAISLEDDSQANVWSNLNIDWQIERQYFKPYPVCRWAQSAVIAAFDLQKKYPFEHSDITKISIGSFHESVRLATTTPTTTEQAQYSLPFPVAAALVHKRLTVKEVDGAGLVDETVKALSKRIELYEVDNYNSVFPERRISELQIILNDGTILESGATEANGDPEIPLSDAEINTKFNLFAEPLLGTNRVKAIQSQVLSMGDAGDIESLASLLFVQA